MDKRCLVGTKLDIPILIVSGDRDIHCPVDESAKLAQYFSNVRVVKHSGGHIIPNIKAAVAEFLKL